jgi:hypothetical protein
MKSKYCDSSTYGHSQLKTGHPVRSAIHKQLNGRLVLRWVTTWESLLLYVLYLFLFSRVARPVCSYVGFAESCFAPAFWLEVTGRVSVSARNGRKETPGCDLLFSMLLDTDLFSPGASTIL